MGHREFGGIGIGGVPGQGADAGVLNLFCVKFRFGNLVKPMYPVSE